MGGTRLNNYVDVMSFHKGVTGSCNLLVAKYDDGLTIKGAVDCGLFQEREYSELNKKLPFNANELDFVLVTHNHVDHTGRLPLLIKKGYTKNIYMTYVTENLIPLAMEDSLKVLTNLAKRNNEEPLYSVQDKDIMLSKIIGCKFNREVWVNPYVKATFLSNGHLPGAALILVQIVRAGYEDINILFTGDYNSKNMFFNVEPIPDYVKNLPLTVVQESTYGNMDSSQIEECFERNVLEAVSENKSIVIPVFSLGRAQEILHILSEWQKNGKLSTKVPIYFDGKLAIRYTDLFLRGSIQIKERIRNSLIPKNLKYVEDKQMRMSLLEESQGSKIILTTSGMGTYGPAQTYLPRYLGREDCLIQFTGYTAEGTLGDRIKSAEVGEIINVAGVLVEKKARVEYTTEFSAHAKADEMIDFLNQFTNLRLVLVNHGETQVKNEFAKRIMKSVNTKATGILGEQFFRIDPYGFVKSMNTKFN